jgi:hypothetical protein
MLSYSMPLILILLVFISLPRLTNTLNVPDPVFEFVISHLIFSTDPEFKAN